MRVLLSGVQAVADVKTIRDSDERRRESRAESGEGDSVGDSSLTSGREMKIRC